MYASIWRFAGDPAELLRSYDAMLSEIPPASLRLHLCLRTADGIAIVDTCPTREAFEEFANGPFAVLSHRHGLPEPSEVSHGPVHVAVADGARVGEG
jgi:hypothetical protein